MQLDCIRFLQEILKPNDTWYFLGDLWCHNTKQVFEFINEIPGTKHILYGNHDDNTIKAQEQHAIFNSANQIKEFKYNDKYIVLCHFELANWNHKHHGAYHFFGHSHKKPPNIYGNGRSMEIGYDSVGKWAISLDEAIDMAELNYKEGIK